MAGRNQILEDPEQHNVTFEKKQWNKAAEIAKQERVSIHEIIRRAVDALPAKKQSQPRAS